MGKSTISTGPLGVWWCMIYSPVLAGGGPGGPGVMKVDRLLMEIISVTCGPGTMV